MALQTIIRGGPPGKYSLETFAARLLEKIMHAPTGGEAVRRYIKIALRALYNKKMNGYIIQRFIDRVTLYLDSRGTPDPREAANIRMAKERLQEFRKGIAIADINEDPAIPNKDDALYEQG